MDSDNGRNLSDGVAVRRPLVWGGRAALAVGLVALWEISIRRGWLPGISFSSPREVFDQLLLWLLDVATYRHAAMTIIEAGSGFIIGAGLALAVVILYIYIPTLETAVTPILAVLNGVPRMALAPLYVLWFGLGFTPKIVLVATVVFFIVVFNLQRGLQTIDPTLRAQLQVLGASGSEMLRDFYIPALFGWLTTGLRTSIGFSFAAAVVAEYLGSIEGLGYLVFFGLARFRPHETFAGIIIMMAVVILVDLGLRRIERRFWYWDIHKEGVV